MEGQDGIEKDRTFSVAQPALALLLFEKIAKPIVPAMDGTRQITRSEFRRRCSLLFKFDRTESQQLLRVFSDVGMVEIKPRSKNVRFNDGCIA